MVIPPVETLSRFGLPTSPKWLVIGGGVLGLSLADQLAANGQSVTLYEAAPDLGGLANRWQVGDVHWDRFYHVTLLSDTTLRGLLEQLDLDAEMRWITTRTGFFCDQQLYSLSNSWEFLRFPPLSLVQKVRLAWTIAYAARIKNWQRLERLTVSHWLERNSGRQTFEKIWLPLLKAKLGSAYTQASAAFIWAYIARMYKARRSGLKTEMFGYLPGGYGRLLERWQAQLVDRGVKLVTGRRVEKIARQFEMEERRTPLHVTSVDCNGEPTAEEFDGVICTLPSPVISQLCPQLAAEEHQALNNIRYLGVNCLSLVMRKPLSPYYVTNITDASVPMTGIIEMTTVVDPQELGGNHLVYLPRYAPSDDPTLAEPETQLTERFLAALGKIHPEFNRQDVLATRLARAKYVMAIPTLNYSNQLPPIQTSLPGFFALNSAHITGGTLNVNETLELGKSAFAQEILPRIVP